jgi:hypothetical protein
MVSLVKRDLARLDRHNEHLESIESKVIIIVSVLVLSGKAPTSQKAYRGCRGMVHHLCSQSACCVYRIIRTGLRQTVSGKRTCTVTRMVYVISRNLRMSALIVWFAMSAWKSRCFHEASKTSVTISIALYHLITSPFTTPSRRRGLGQKRTSANPWTPFLRKDEKLFSLPCERQGRGHWQEVGLQVDPCIRRSADTA